MYNEAHSVRDIIEHSATYTSCMLTDKTGLCMIGL